MKMKKGKINLIKLGILLFGISIFLINCEKDEYQEEGINGVNQKILSKKISFDKIPNINAIKNSLDKIHSKNSKKTLSKSNNNLGEFIILKNEVLLMEYSETHTYTFKIIREKPEYYIENIVLHYNLETENYDEYLVQYNVNKNEYLGIINGKYINESTQIKITKLDTGTITLSGKSNCSRTCQTISLRCTAGSRHEFGDPECCVNKGSCSPLYAATVYQSCTTKCTDTLSDGSDEGLASSGGGGSTGVATNPLPAEPCFEGFSGETDENGVSVCNDLIEEGIYIDIANKLNIKLEQFDILLNSPTFDVLNNPWLELLRSYAKTLEELKDKIPQILWDKMNQYLDRQLISALTKTAFKFNPDSDTTKESNKQHEFENDGKRSIGVLLYEFANGTGKDEREFRDGDFWNKFFEGDRKDKIKSDFVSVLANNNLTFNQFVTQGNMLPSSYKFSPDHAGVLDSFEEHRNANWVQFFVGGSSVQYRPSSQIGYIDVLLINPTSRKSLLLHIGDNYDRHPQETIPLSTIKQYFYITIKIR
jgi:hypothetical protein